MATEPPPFLTFRKPDERVIEGPKQVSTGDVERIRIYQLALDLASQLYTVVELTETVERFFLRDTLDRKSAAIPMLISRGLATAHMSERRTFYRRAMVAVHDCMVLLDVLQQRGTIEEEVVLGARSTASVLSEELAPLTVEPRVV